MAVDVIIDPSSGQIYWNDNAGVGTQTIAISGNASNAINIVGYSNFFSPGGGGLGTQILATFTDSATSTFTPGTNAYDLGSSSLRWNFYGTGGNFTGAISTSSSTASTSSTTGALIVSGGAGIAKTSYFGQDVVIQGSTASTSSTTGALTVSGGVGIGGSLNVGNSSVADVIIYNTDYTSSANLNLRTGTGASLKGAVIGFNSTELKIQNTFRTITNYADVFQFYVTNLDDYQLIISSAGATFYNTTASTSSTTGALRLQGGAGIAKTSYFGQSVVVQGTTASGSTTTGALVVTGGVGIGGSLNVFGTIDVSNNIEVLSQKEVRFFNSANTFYTGLKAGSPSANVTFTLPIADGSANQVLYTNGSAALGWTTVASVSAITTLNGLTAATQTFATGASGTDFNISSGTSTHTFNIPYAGAASTGLITTQTQTIAGAKTFSSQTIVSDTTASTTTGTGALLVFGGLGVSAQINAASLQTSGNAVISGNLTFNGIGVFGNATTDTINSLARYISDLLPSADNSYDLGNNSLGWRNFRVSGVGTIATLAVTSSTGSTNTTTGALVVTGGVGIGGSLNVGSRNLTFAAANLLAGFASSVNSYNQIVVQNLSPQSAASADYIVANDVSTDSTFYGSMGMNSSGFTGAGSLSLPSAVYFTSTSGDLVLGSTTANILRFVYNSGSTDSMQITGTAVSVLYSTASTSSSTGALTVVGGVGIGGSLWTSTSNLASVSGVTLSNGTITGTLSGTATSAQNIATTTDTSSTLYVLGSRSSTGFGGTAVYVDTNISFSGSTITASLTGTATTATRATNTDITLDTTSTIYLTGSRSNASIGSTPVYVLSGVSALGNTITATTFSGTASSATNTANINVTLDTTSTIFITGSRSNASIGSTPSYVLSGVSALGNTLTATTFVGALTGTASIATSSVNSATTTDTTSTLYLLGSRSSTGFAGTTLYVDSSISILGSQITAGVWGGTAISAVNGGTGQVSYTIGDILYASSTTALSKLSAGTAGSVLGSNGAGAAPSWKAPSSGGSPAGSSSWLQYNNGGSFGATSHLAYGGNGNNDFIISAPYSGATQGQINIGLGITGFDGVTLGKFAGSASGTVIAVNQASGFTGNFADFQLAASSKFTIGYDGKVTVVGAFSLPTTAGTAGSILTSNGSGNQLYWSAPSSGGGAGTVAAPTSSTLAAYYPGTGASVASYSRVSLGTANASMEILAQNSLPGLIVNATNGSVVDSVQFKSSFGDVYWALSNSTQLLKSTNGGTLKFDGSGVLWITNPGSLYFYNSAETFALNFVAAPTANVTYTLPPTAPATGTSVLQSNTTGTLSWVPMSAGSGSGTVSSGTGGSVAFYTGTGTTVGGAPGFTYTTSGTASTINVFGGGAIGTTIFTVQATSSTSVRVGIGTNLPQYELEIVGEISATNKSFVIDHPTKPGKKLRYGSLEGPENGVYVRGELKDTNIIETPEHWVGLVYPDSLTVTLTPIGRFSHLYVEKIEDYKVFIADAYMNPIHCYYTVWAERKDIPKLVTEY